MFGISYPTSLSLFCLLLRAPNQHNLLPSLTTNMRNTPNTWYSFQACYKPTTNDTPNTRTNMVVVVKASLVLQLLPVLILIATNDAALSTSLSDHCPLLLSTLSGPRPPRPFRFENYWTRITSLAMPSNSHTAYPDPLPKDGNDCHAPQDLEHFYNIRKQA